MSGKPVASGAVVKRRSLKKLYQPNPNPNGQKCRAADRIRPSPRTETSRQTSEKKTMKIQINSDNHITGREALVEQAEATVTGTLGHLADRITRIEVHLSDENGQKTGGLDKRCLMEARLEGHQPIAVTNEAETIDEAIAGAADKLKRSITHTLGRLNVR
jgi:ribosome-associated translation inhibitor RaiA